MAIRMPLLSVYLLRRWWLMATAFTAVFVIILMLLYAAEVMGDIAGGDIPVSMLGWQLLLHVPDVIRTVLPLAMVMAVLLTRQQMRRDGEWAVLTVSGLRPQQIRSVLLVFMSTGLVLLLLISGWLQPSAQAMQARLYQRAANSAEFWGVLPGRFNALPDNGGVIYAASMDRDGVAMEVFLRVQDEAGTQVLSSARGRFRMRPGGDRYVTLMQGRRSYLGTDGKLQILDFEQAEIRLPMPAQVASESDQSAWSWSRLLAANDRAANVEMQQRLAHPFMLIALFVWLHGMLRTDRIRSEQGGNADMLVMALVFVVYLNLINLVTVWISAGRLAVLPGFWWAHLLVLAAALIWQTCAQLPERFGRSRFGRSRSARTRR